MYKSQGQDQTDSSWEHELSYSYQIVDSVETAVDKSGQQELDYPPELLRQYEVVDNIVVEIGSDDYFPFWIFFAFPLRNNIIIPFLLFMEIVSILLRST